MLTKAGLSHLQTSQREIATIIIVTREKINNFVTLESKNNTKSSLMNKNDQTLEVSS